MPLIRSTEEGLYCEAGGFHIDPWKPVERAVITHAHSDHATPGCGGYLASVSGALLLRARLGDVPIETLAWGQSIPRGDVRVSLHPAGHILGSAQVRVERTGSVNNDDGGRIWVFSGDYKHLPDPTCAPFEPVPCDTFITESTFGLPVYRWPDPVAEFAEINRWWAAARDRARTCVVYAYSLGKAQRLLAHLDPSIGPIAVHGAVVRINEAYLAAGISLPDAPRLDDHLLPSVRGRGLVVAPPSAASTPWARKLAGPGGLEQAQVSGWMRIRGTRRWQSLDRGFVISDHADWHGLLECIHATGCSRVGVTHGYAQPLARWLAEHGTESFVLPTRYQGEAAEGDSQVETPPSLDAQEGAA